MNGGQLGNINRQAIRLPLGSILILTLALSGPAIAQEKEFEKCGSIADNATRLECLDRLLKNRQKNAESIVPGSSPQWVVENLLDPIDDSISSYASLKASKVDGAEKLPFLILRCDKNREMDLWINWLSPIKKMTEGEARVTIRIRNEAAYTDKWFVSDSVTSYRDLWLPDAKRFVKVDEFVQALKSGGRLLFRVESRLTGNYITAFFHIEGVDTALKRLKNVCQW